MIEPSKTVLITGASRGIGAAILDSLMIDKLEIYGTATSDKGAAAISEKLKSNDVKGAGLILRVDKHDSIEQIADYLKKQDKLPDIIVNNAGITRDNLFA